MPLLLPVKYPGFVLRHLTRDDATRLADIEFDSVVKRFLAPPEMTRDEWMKRFNPESYGGFAVDVGGALAGRASILRYAYGRKGYAEIAVVISRQFLGTGLGRQVAGALIEIAFTHLGARGVVGVVHPEHTASIALLRALGFRKRGQLDASVKPWQHGHLVYRLPRRVA